MSNETISCTCEGNLYYRNRCEDQIFVLKKNLYSAFCDTVNGTEFLARMHFIPELAHKVKIVYIQNFTENPFYPEKVPSLEKVQVAKTETHTGRRNFIFQLHIYSQTHSY